MDDTRISVPTMRAHFEAAVKELPQFRDSTPLGVVEINGEFSHYFDSDTDTMWIGFALGMRVAEELAQADTGEGAGNDRR